MGGGCIGSEEIEASGGVTAPPDGLYLVNIQYPARFSMPEVKNGLGEIWNLALMNEPLKQLRIERIDNMENLMNRTRVKNLRDHQALKMPMLLQYRQERTQLALVFYER